MVREPILQSKPLKPFFHVLFVLIDSFIDDTSIQPKEAFTYFFSEFINVFAFYD